MGKGDKPVTYEETHALHFIVHRKGWLWLQQVRGRCSGWEALAPRVTAVTQTRDKHVREA